MHTEPKVFVAVTGAQGVGKSTFSDRLISELTARRHDVSLLAGLGSRLTAEGYILGENADERAVAAVFELHLRREREAASGLVLLDRCILDALAYMRTLRVTPPPLANLYEEIAKVIAPRIRLVIFLEVSPCFEQSDATHESSDFRLQIDRALQAILTELKVNVLVLDAAAQDCIKEAVAAIETLST